jgi:hypothetical protein
MPIKDPRIVCLRPYTIEEGKFNKVDLVETCEGAYARSYLPSYCIEYGYYFEDIDGFHGPFSTYEECKDVLNSYCI